MLNIFKKKEVEEKIGEAYMCVIQGATIRGLDTPCKPMNWGIGFQYNQFIPFRKSDIKEERETEYKIYNAWVDKKYVFFYETIKEKYARNRNTIEEIFNIEMDAKEKELIKKYENKTILKKKTK